MKIFSPTESNSPKEGVKSKKSSKSGSVASQKRPASPEKQNVSDNEIREKLASHSEISNSAKSQMMQKNSKALGAGFMNEDIKPVFIQPSESKDSKDLEESEESGKKADSLKDSHLLLSDVKLNDPTDSNTQEKLKTVLKMGAFNFNPKEKEALEKILGN